MQYVMLLVEQLDRAAHELATDHPINNRIALILVDNAAELIVHHRLEYHLLVRDRPFQKLSPKQRLMARGQYLGDRLKVLRHLNDLDDREQEFIKVAHGYRGELYHAGLRRNDIVRAIAARYFDLVCDLFVRLPQGFRAHYSGDTVTSTVTKYLGTDPASLSALHVKDEDIAGRLRAELPTDIPSLQPALATSARRSIARTEDRLDFLVADNPGKMDLKKLLFEAQHHWDLTRALARDGVEGTWMTHGYSERVKEVQAEMAASWKPRHARVPLARWRTRADEVEAEKDALRALVLFHALRRDMEYLEEAIGELTLDLDGWIQNEVDRLRGK